MKKMLVFLTCVIMATLFVSADIVLAQDDDGIKAKVTYLRYRFNHFVESEWMTDDTREYFDDDLDMTFEYSVSDDVLFHIELEPTDSTMGEDQPTQSAYNDWVKDYYGQWTPESLADSAFKLKAGSFSSVGTWANNINNDDSHRGALGVSWKIGNTAIALGYSKKYEGDRDDDVEGDMNVFRAKVDVPLGESGYELSGYGAFFGTSDKTLAEGVQGDGSVFLGGLAFSGAVQTINLYASAGFTTGTDDYLVDDEAVEYDVAGYFAAGSISLNVGQVTLGVEAGFGSGDDDASDDSIDDFISYNNDYGFDEIIEDEILDNGIRNKIYAKVSASMAPTEKLSLSGAVSYVKPTEKFTSDVTGKSVDTYGVEVNGTLNYKLAANLKYVLMGAFASVDEDWFDESSQFQMMNRLEFLF